MMASSRYREAREGDGDQIIRLPPYTLTLRLSSRSMMYLTRGAGFLCLLIVTTGYHVAITYIYQHKYTNHGKYTANYQNT